MRRRDFVTLIGGAATWPLAARAQQTGRVRRIGVLMSTAADDAQGQVWSAAFAQGLQQLGWEVGGNFRIDYRWGAGDTDRFRRYAAELVALGPDVILGTAASIVADLQQASRTTPIVFVSTIDPVGAGLVASLARPGGNATGFTAYEFSLSAKLLELLKDIAPGGNARGSHPGCRRRRRVGRLCCDPDCSTIVWSRVVTCRRARRR
jgi:putative tryptophan/tyrosine transport system substrate-binding protein